MATQTIESLTTEQQAIFRSEIGAGTPSTAADVLALVENAPKDFRDSLQLQTLGRLDATKPVYIYACINKQVQALRVMISTDGVNFTQVRNSSGSPDLYRPSGGRDLRDPSIARIGDKWWICYTVGDYGSNNVPPTSIYNDGQNSPVFGIASSSDLVTWTHVVDVTPPNSVPGNAMQVWGPEFHVFSDGKAYVTCPSANFTTGVSKVYIFEPTNGSLTAWVSTGELAIAGTSAHFLEQFIQEDPSGGVWWLYMRNTSAAVSGIYRSTVGPFTGYTLWTACQTWDGVSAVVWNQFGIEGFNMIPLGNGHWKIFGGDSVAGSPGRGAYVCDSYDNLKTATAFVQVVGDAPNQPPDGFDHGTCLRVAPKIGSEHRPVFSNNWRPRLDGNQFDYVSGGALAHLSPGASPSAQFVNQFGPVLSSHGMAVAGSANSVQSYFASIGRASQCLASGAAEGNLVGFWHPSIQGTNGGHFPAPWVTTPTLHSIVQRIRIPSLANRAGRNYYLAGGYPASGGMVFLFPWVRLKLATSALECTVSTANNVWGTPQTSTGAVQSPAVGTFTAWSLPTTSAVEILVRYRKQSGVTTLEVAAYSELPVWQTVLRLTTGTVGLLTAVAADGSATGAAADGTNAIELVESWEGVKF